MKRILCIGGWGHWPEVFQCLEERSDIEMCGVAPAYDGEDLSAICAKDLMKGVPMFGSADELLKIGRTSRIASDADYLIANTLNMVEGDRAGAYLISDTGEEFIPRADLAKRCAALVCKPSSAGRG